jgi:hypothetical protein
MVVLVDSVDATPVFFLCRAITFKMPRSKISVKISLRAEVALCSSSFHDAMMDDSRESNRSDSAVMVRSGNVCALHPPHQPMCVEVTSRELHERRALESVRRAAVKSTLEELKKVARGLDRDTWMYL